jgi:hypothetical protein
MHALSFFAGFVAGMLATGVACAITYAILICGLDEGDQ